MATKAFFAMITECTPWWLENTPSAYAVLLVAKAADDTEYRCQLTQARVPKVVEEGEFASRLEPAYPEYEDHAISWPQVGRHIVVHVDESNGRVEWWHHARAGIEKFGWWDGVEGCSGTELLHRVVDTARHSGTDGDFVIWMGCGDPPVALLGERSESTKTLRLDVIHYSNPATHSGEWKIDTPEAAYGYM